MAGVSTGVKKKLTISSCTLDGGKVSVGDESFEVMINPSGYNVTHSISYNGDQTPGEIGQEKKFSSIDAEKINFDIVLDGTGVVNHPVAGTTFPDVKTQVQQLNSIVYSYKGENHEPNIVRLLWGSLVFFGRLDSMSVEYTLFKPSGEPLRAKIKLAFSGFMSKEEETLKANKSSPDLTHIVEVKSADTLPGLCHKIYRDSSYYPEVARVNNLTGFREIKPGMKLIFPPLR